VAATSSEFIGPIRRVSKLLAYFSFTCGLLSSSPNSGTWLCIISETLFSPPRRQRLAGSWRLLEHRRPLRQAGKQLNAVAVHSRTRASVSLFPAVDHAVTVSGCCPRPLYLANGRFVGCSCTHTYQSISFVLAHLIFEKFKSLDL
jgi:hypothetical protein